MYFSRPLKKSEIIAYGAGDAAFALIGTLLGFYQLYFFTDVFGINPASVAVIMLIIKIWDTINHPLMGILADRTQSRHGRYRPWILYTIIPLAISSVLIFYIPTGLSEWQKTLYALSVSFVYWTALSAANVPYIALMSVMTPNTNCRANLASARFIGAFGASALAMFFTKDLVSWFGSGSEASGFLGVASLYALVASLALYWTFLATKERISIKPDPNFSPSEDIGSLLRSVPFLTVIAVSIFVGIFVHIKSGLTVFYLKYVIQVPTLDKYFMAGGIISCLVGVCFVSLFLGKVDKKNLFISFMSGNALFVAAIYWVSPTNITLLLIFHFMNSFLGGACAPIFFAIYSDIIDYLELKTGFRSSALINSLGLFAGTLGAAIGGFLAPIGLVWIGYIANAPQNETTIAGLSFLFTIAPAFFAGIAALLMAFYPLSKKRMVLISYRLSKRRIYTNIL